jgi:hypothetical protein
VQTDRRWYKKIDIDLKFHYFDLISCLFIFYNVGLSNCASSVIDIKISLAFNYVNVSLINCSEVSGLINGTPSLSTIRKNTGVR